MNAPAYQLNASEAREGSGSAISRVAKTGAYTGIFTKAKHVLAQTGAAGIEFEFESANKEQARFTLYTHNKDGQAIFGAKQLQALMAVLKLRNIAAKPAQIEEYNYDSGQKEKIDAEVYPELTGKPVGVVFQMEEYLSGQGELKMRPNFFAPFDANSKQMAVEILDQKSAGGLDKILAVLKDKPLRNRPAQAAPQGQSYVAPAELDDIPF
jgi:hypothetical protein